MDLILFGAVFCLVFIIAALAIATCEGELTGAAFCCMFGSVMSFLLAVLGVVMEVRL